MSFGGEDVYSFSKWSDGGARNHAAKINLAPTTLTATYKKTSGDASGTCSGATTVSTSGAWRTGLLTTDTDVDWYKFSLTSSATMRIILGNLPEDASLSLYSGCSKLLVTSDRGGTQHRGDLQEPRQGQLLDQGDDQGHRVDGPVLAEHPQDGLRPEPA